MLVQLFAANIPTDPAFKHVYFFYFFFGLTGGAQSYWLTTHDSAGRTHLPGA
jgi:hypothetical protein